MPIDYSKWDHFGDDDDDESSLVGDERPRVTRLAEPSRVTRTTTGELVVESLSSTTDSRTKDANKTKPQDEGMTIPESSWTEKGGKDGTLYWSQDRESVTLRIPVASKKIKHCQIHNRLPHADRHSAVSTKKKPRLEIVGTEISLTLAHAVHAEQDDPDYLDWSLTSRNGQQYVQVTLLKAVPMPGMTLWWKKPLDSSKEEINVDWAQSNTNNTFQQAWKEAHEQFRKNIS